MKWSTPVALGCSAIDDVLIAGTLVYILHRNRTEFRRTNQMITKLIIFSSQTGLITTVAASITIGIWVFFRLDVEHLYMCFPMGGLYATCLLSNFIARESYLQPQTIRETEISGISFGRFTQEVHMNLDSHSLSDTRSRQQETLVMEGGGVSDSILLQASSK
ncbi:uncharacterized protein EDB91DRAFT_215278 [Suillus paluster]|uniref:uncharacterized protein n=1 Tax=Suillus paluster TaxID=48578 RepID=UPI001B887171|nr:uncharacterized protein EDB91DRAFT_215278 [Suillus paluster]KAG1722214.1 hypothetical protein EDB91DRAFT_215278 [Suillus paluster]